MTDRPGLPLTTGEGNTAARRHGRDYIERTIATVRNHRDADNCWPQWANIFADEIEAQWAESDALREQLDAARQALKAICESTDSGPWIVEYRVAGGGYEGLQAIARAALGVEGPAG